MKIGSLFSGYGGLDLAVEEVFGGETVWHCEIEDAPSKVLAAHWPGIPNLRDVTSVDWASLEPVDVICGGSPCQDVSAAGKRAGMRAGTRSGLWASTRPHGTRTSYEAGCRCAECREALRVAALGWRLRVGRYRNPYGPSGPRKTSPQLNVGDPA